MDGSRQRGGPPSFDWGVVVLAVRQTLPAGQQRRSDARVNLTLGR